MSSGIEAPGQLKSHYAPSKPLRLDAEFAVDGEWMIGFGAVAGDSNLSKEGNLVHAAAALFDALHDAELSDKPGIAIARIEGSGALAAAINDRLSRAAY